MKDWRRRWRSLSPFSFSQHSNICCITLRIAPASTPIRFMMATFSPSALFSGTSIAVLTYMGFDGITTLAEEAKDPRHDILRATVLVCVITGVLASMEVYAAQLIWPRGETFSSQTVDTAYAYVAG